MKGIILSGGLGSRLYPVTQVVSKQLLPIFNKPMIYYSLSTLMLAEIRDILLISTPQDKKKYKQLLGDGSSFGVNLKFISQHKPRGLVDAFILGKKFIGNDSVCLVLGDNIFYGNNFSDLLIQAKKNVDIKKKAVIFSYNVKNPSEYGIVKTKKNKIISIEEKPKKSKSNLAVVGLYFYPNSVLQMSKKIKFSKRKELEISDLNNLYLKKDLLSMIEMGRGYAWFDAGTVENMFEVSQFIKTIESRVGYKIGCLEEIAYTKKWISKENLKLTIKKYAKTEYGRYLNKLLK